jgi:hypothetical protein
MWKRLAFVTFTVSVLLCPLLVDAEVFDLDLGARPATGAAAVAGFRRREVATVRALACNDEINFLAGINEGERVGDWPKAHLIAKAALLTGAFEPETQPAVFALNPGTLRERSCIAPENDPNLDKWRRVFHRGDDSEAFEGAAQRWQRVADAPDATVRLALLRQELTDVYVRRFGSACRDTVPSFRNFTTVGPVIVLSRECLMRQIAGVIGNRSLGMWKFDKNGNRVPYLPGTSASKLPCLTDWALINNGLAPSDWKWPWEALEGVEGDGDMGVIEYTRLTHLLYGARAANPDLRADADPALRKLNEWLLTLRGGPARETYNVFWSCGNHDNSFGTATDYLDDKDVFNDDLQQSMAGDDDGEPSFWERLWKFLRLVLVLVAIGLAVGFVLGTGIAGGFGAAAAVAAATAAAVLGAAALAATLWNIGIEETENHLLMQNSSKYLKNKLMMAELRAANDRDGFDDIVDQNEELRDWLLDRLQRIAEDDFVEYNSKPYNSFSLRSILNLLDFACDISWDWDQSTEPPRGDRACHPRDRVVVTAASAVFDLSAAKMALGSSQGRRVIPFRRLVEENTRYRDVWQRRNDKDDVVNEHPRRILDVGPGADHLVGALQLWAGTTHHGANGRASSGSVREMVWHATSRYRPHEIVLDLALDKSTSYEQTYNHHTYERYSNGPGWLLTAGGDSEHAAQGLRIHWGLFGFLGWSSTIYPPLFAANDRGVGVPTTLMATGVKAPRDTYLEFLRFEGEAEDWGYDGLSFLQSFSNNGCVTGRFACGLRFEIPGPIAGCMRRLLPDKAPRDLYFISSAECPEYRDGDDLTSNDFFVAVFRTSCIVGPGWFARRRCDGQPWGFIEVANPAAFGGSLEKYASDLLAANPRHFARWEWGDVRNPMTFWSVTENREIRFTPADESFDEDCRACGSIVRHESGARFTINHPGRAGHILIDLSDEDEPIRSGEGGIHLDQP